MRRRDFREKTNKITIYPVQKLNGTVLAKIPISMDGREVGYVRRGHRKTDASVTEQGHFTKALETLEEYEKQLFVGKQYPAYKLGILDGLQERPYGKLSNALVEKFIESINTPTHIDFTADPYIVYRLMKRGYEFIPEQPATGRFGNFGFSEKPTQEQLMNYFEKNRKNKGLSGRAIFVLTKKAGY